VAKWRFVIGSIVVLVWGLSVWLVCRCTGGGLVRGGM